MASEDYTRDSARTYGRTWPRTVAEPSLFLNFTSATALDPRITFSRGSQATLFDSTGTLRYAKHNLLLQSQDFATTWANFQTTEATNVVIAPDGSLTADKLIEDTNAGTHLIQQSFTTTAVAHTFSVYIKAAERTWAFLANSTIANASAYFDLTSGTLGTVGAAATASIVAVGNGWYRCSITMTTTAASNAFRVQLANGNNGISYTGDGTSGIFIWGAQLNLANMEGGVTSSLTTYYPTTTAAYYAPRFDYNPSTLQPRGLLIEEQRTNSIRNNTMQGAVAGTPGTMPTNWATYFAPTGVTRTVVGTGVQNGITYIDVRYSGTPSAGTEISIYPEVASSLLFSAGAVVTWGAYLAIVAGATTNITGAFLRTLSYNGATYLGEGTSSNLIGGLTATMQRSNFANYTVAATADRVVAVLTLYATAGAAIDITLRIGLPQMEQGAFATSVIPTTTTALTRNADVATMTGTNFSSWFNAAEGAFAVTYINYTAATGSLFATDDGTANNRIINYTSTGTAPAFRVITSGAEQANFALGTASAGSIAKIATTYRVNDFAGSLNGAAVVTDTSGTIPTGQNTARIGTNVASTTALNGHIQRISFWPTRLPNATLQALTA